MKLLEVFILSVTVFFTAAILMLLTLAIYVAIVKIFEMKKKRSRRNARGQGTFS